MPRPKLYKRINFNPNVRYFKPQGVPLRVLDEVELTLEELEALRLKNMEKLKHIEASEKMKTSQRHFSKNFNLGLTEKSPRALIEGKAIKINE